MKKSRDGLFQRPAIEAIWNTFLRHLAVAGLVVVLLCLVVSACDQFGPERIGAGEVREERLNPSPEERERSSMTLGQVDYYYRGSYFTTYVSPFVRCTRPGDYMIVRFDEEGAKNHPVIGIRVLKDELNPQITESSFVASSSASVIKPRIRKLEEDVIGTWEISWEIRPEWRTVRIDQEVTVRFEMAIQKKSPGGDMSWVKNPEPTRSPDVLPLPSVEVCPP